MSKISSAPPNSSQVSLVQTVFIIVQKLMRSHCRHKQSIQSPFFLLAIREQNCLSLVSVKICIFCPFGSQGNTSKLELCHIIVKTLVQKNPIIPKYTEGMCDIVTINIVFIYSHYLYRPSAGEPPTTI